MINPIDKAKSLHKLNISNGSHIRALKPGEWISIGVGKVVFEVMAYNTPNYDEPWLVYDFQVLQDNVEIMQVSHTSLAHTMDVYADFAWQDIEPIVDERLK